MKIRYFYVVGIVAASVAFIHFQNQTKDPNMWGPDLLPGLVQFISDIVVLTLLVAWILDERRNAKRK